VAAVSLSPHEQQELESIEEWLSGSDPKLASLLSTFTRLTAGERMPVHELTGGWRNNQGHPDRGLMRRSACRLRQHVNWRAARLVFMALLALALLAGAMAMIGDRARACPVPSTSCAGQLPPHAARPAEPFRVM
jgi:hypothetical protein